jgi:hypothetical protein
MVLTAGIKVVIDAPDTDLFECADFVLAHQAQGAADVDADFCTNFFDGFGDFMNFFVRRTAPAVDADVQRTSEVPEAAGVCLITGAFPLIAKDDAETVERAAFLYDAMYAALQQRK